MLPLAATALGSPLQTEQVSADAKWLVHLDVDRLRSTRVGDYLINQMLDPKVSSLVRQLDFDLDWKQVHSLTAYGTIPQSKSSFDGVLVIKTDLDLRKLLDAVVDKAKSDNDNESARVQKTQEGDNTTYSLKDHMFASFRPGKPTIVSKSLDSIHKAREVLWGTAPNLASTKMFSEFPKPQSPYFLMGAVDNLKLSPEPGEESRDGDGLNPKAKILKLAEGGRIVLGEDANQLFADLSLKAKSTELVTQIQQVVQGMIALASLSQPDNQDLQQLAQSAKVSSSGNIVTLKLGYPADQAIQVLTNKLSKRLALEKSTRQGESQTRKRRSKADATPEEPAKSDEK